MPVHDHRHGDCDLPPRPAREDTGTRCRWVTTLMALISRPCCAGCKIRSHIRERQEWARAANRRERYAGRREARRFAARDGGRDGAVAGARDVALDVALDSARDATGD